MKRLTFVFADGVTQASVVADTAARAIHDNLDRCEINRVRIRDSDDNSLTINLNKVLYILETKA
jgi:hypothetical protein